jgi:hypothetical protein
METRERDPTNPRTDFSSAYWAIATRAEFREGDFEVARRYYGKLMAEYPTDMRAFGAGLALKRMDEVEARLRAGQPVPSTLAIGGTP